MLISPFNDRPITDYRKVVTTLLDNAPPGTDELREETKGEGLLAVYREQITTVFTPLIQTPADLTFIQVWRTIYQELQLTFFSAYKVRSYLSKFGAFTSDKEAQLRNYLNEMIRLKTVDYDSVYLSRGAGILLSVLFGHNYG